LPRDFFRISLAIAGYFAAAGLAGAAKILLTWLIARELSADRGAGLWPTTPASVPASNPMAARMPGPEGTPAG
jgi:hypothetical protein